MPWRLGTPNQHAALRLITFLALTAAFAVALGFVASAAFGARELGLVAQLALPHAIIAIAALGAGIVAAARLDGEARPLAALGLPLEPGVPGLVVHWVGVGALLIAPLVALQLLVGWLEPRADAGTPAAWLGHAGTMALLFGVAAASEELLFRGYGFQRLVEWLGVRFAVIVDAALFGLIHVNNPRSAIVPLVNIALAGVLLAGAYLRTRSLWAAIGLHWSWNWSTTLFDRPVSGIEFDAPGYDFLETGPDFLTGGEFGLEGGLLTTIVLAGAIAWVYRK